MVTHEGKPQVFSRFGGDRVDETGRILPGFCFQIDFGKNWHGN
jgi:hypothetical protein